MKDFKSQKNLAEEKNTQKLQFFKRLTLILCSFLFLGQIHAQESIKVTGVIKDETGIPIIGATIMDKEQKKGTTTNVDGVYTMDVPSNGSLVISYLGFHTQTILIKNRKNIDIVMRENTVELEQVVVVGYGTQRVKDITGSIVRVDMEAVSDKPVPNLIEALAGEIPGVTVSNISNRPGDPSSLTIRQGFSNSKGGGSSGPLIVIDDVIQVNPQTGSTAMDQLSLLDPNDVESMTVLRDASAAIYGSRASQGAIVIKTKRGKQGIPKISYSGKFQTKNAVGHSKVMDAHEYGIFTNRFLRAKDPGIASDKLFSDTELESMKSLNYNWLDKAWKSAFTMQHSVNVSGGSERATYFAGASFYEQDANLGKQDYDRWTFRTGVDVKVMSNLKFSAGLSGNSTSQEKSFSKSSNFSDGGYGDRLKGENADYGILLHMPQYIPWSQTVDGKEQWISPALGPHKVAGNQNVANQMAGWNYFATEGNSTAKNQSFSYNANFSLQYDFKYLPGLTVKASYSRSETSNDSEQAHLPYTLALGRNTNNADKHLYGENTEWIVRENDKSSRVVYSDNTSLSEQMNLFLTYNKTINDHTFGGLFSIERGEDEARSRRLFYENPISGAYNGTHNTAGKLIPDHSYSSKIESGTLSYLGRANYKYGTKYLAEFLFRADASTKFAPENYWGFFPGVSAGWVISEESWFGSKATDWVDYLKLRASFGITGKDNIGGWRWAQYYDYSADKGLGFGNSGGSLVPGVKPAVTPNRDVKWDQTTKYNIGLDVNVLNNRLTGGFDFYYDKTKNLLTEMTGEIGTPISVGGSMAELNYAAIDAWGGEIQITWKDKVGDFHYNIGVQTGFRANKWKRQIEHAPSLASANTARVGRSTFMPEWGYKVWQGNGGNGVLRNQNDIDQYWNYLTELATAVGGTPQYLGSTKKDDIYPGMLAFQDLGGKLNADGTQDGPDGKIEKNGEDYAKLASSTKTHGFTTKLGGSWKGISFSMQIATSWGGLARIDQVKQNNSSAHMIWSHPTFLTDMFDATDNPNGKYPSIAYDSYSMPSDFWTVSTFRAYIRNLSIGYTVPAAWSKKAGIERAQFNLAGNNLWDFYNPYPKKYRNMYDNAVSGYPTLRTWSLGVNLTF